MTIDLTTYSQKNHGYEKIIIQVANGAEFIALKMTEQERDKVCGVIYMHLHRDSGRCYIGITEQDVKSRWSNGVGYKANRRFSSALNKYGWNAFDSHILAFCDDRVHLNHCEQLAILHAGGHKSKYTFNLSPGGDLVADNDKPVIGVNLATGEEKRFKSSSDAARRLGLNNTDMPSSVARGERTSTAGWWFRFEDDLTAKLPKVWGEEHRLTQVKALQGKPVILVNYDTKEQKTFPNMEDAAKFLGVFKSQISQVASGDGYSVKGWWVKHADTSYTLPHSKGGVAAREKRDKTVYAVNLVTKELRKFRNNTVADKELDLYKGASASVASGARSSASGWWFTYVENQEPPSEFKGALVAKARSKAVLAINIATNQEIKYPSAKSASEALGVSRAAISKVISGGLASAKGYKFIFA